jgi:hypothetical protein
MRVAMNCTGVTGNDDVEPRDEEWKHIGCFSNRLGWRV